VTTKAAEQASNIAYNSDSIVCEAVAALAAAALSECHLVPYVASSRDYSKQRYVTGYSSPTAQHTELHEKLTVSQPVKKSCDLCHTKYPLQPASGSYPKSHKFGPQVYFNSTVPANSSPASHLLPWNISTKLL